MLAPIIRAVETGLAEVEREVGSYNQDPRSYHAKHRAAIALLADRLALEHGARIVDRWDGGRVRLAGIASSSTQGVAMALRNWITAARKRAGQ